MTPHAWLAVAIGIIGAALGISNGHFEAPAACLIVLAFIASVRAASRWPAVMSSADEASVVQVLCFAFSASLAVYVARPPGIYLENAATLARLPFLAGLLSAVALIVTALVRPRSLSAIRLPLLIGIHFLMGVWLLKHSPNPRIDVFTAHKEGVSALLAGQNPYAMTFTDIYGPTSPFYVPGMSVGGKVQTGFPYTPLQLAIAVVGETLAGDFRYAELAAMSATAALMGSYRRGRFGFLIAALYLFSSRSFFMLEQGWTDGYVILCLAFLMFSARRWKKGLPLALGLFLASKQYTVLALALVPILIPERRRFVSVSLQAAGIALVSFLPFVIWNPSAYVHSTLLSQTRQPFREDSLGFPAILSHVFGWHAPSWFWLVAVALTIWFTWRRCPRTPSGFAMGVGLLYFSMFAFSSHAFCNQYILVTGAFCLALAAAESVAPEGSTPALPHPARDAN